MLHHAGAAMNSLATYIMMGIALITAIGLVLRWVDPFVDDSYKERLKRQFEQFWFSVAELSTTEALGKALRFRYRRTKRNILFFLKIYWSLLFVMLSIVFVENYRMDIKDLLQNNFNVLKKIDFDYVVNFRYSEAARNSAFTAHIFMLVGSYIAVIAIGGFIDYTYFDTASTMTLILGESAMLLNLSLFLFMAPAWLVYNVPDWGARILFLRYQSELLRQAVYINITNFFGDTWKVAHFDFSPSYTDGVVNFAIVTDLLYSLVFFLPALVMVLFQRWPFGQRTFLNIIQWFPEHPKGPIYAISRMFLALASTASKIWRGEEDKDSSDQ
jgi:hypothetical protein